MTLANPESGIKTFKEGRDLKPFFTTFDAFFAFLSLCTFIADVVTDVIVVILYLSNRHWYWAGITVAVLLVSTIVVHFFSLRWYVLDGQSSFTLCLINFLQLGVIYRYLSLLKMGFGLRKNKDELEFQHFQQRHSDVCMLRLFECFLESAPQIVLQMYIMFSTQDWNPLTEISVGVSLLSLAGGIASYSKSIRNATPHKDDLTWLGLFLQMAWRAGTLTSRILAMVLCASVLKAWFLLICFFHWLAMTIWVILQKTDFCTTWWEERFYNGVVAIIYCFCFFNLKEGKSRYRVTAFYTLIFLENVCFTIIYYWITRSETPIIYYLFLTVILSFGIGILCMMIYYCCFHPGGPIFTESKRTSTSLSDLVSQKSILVTSLQFFRTLKSTRLPPIICVDLKLPVKLKPPEENEINDNDPDIDELDSFVENSIPSINVISQRSRVGLLEYIDESPVLRCLGLVDHSYHSLNCLVLPDSSRRGTVNNCFSFLGRGVGQRAANHHQLVNYGFRPQVAQSKLCSPRIHCSCLVLHQVDKNDIFVS